MTREEMKKLADFIIANSKADDVSVYINSWSNPLTRFAENQVTQNVSNEEYTVTLSVAFGQKTASVTTERLDSNYLKRVINRAERIAQNSQEDHEYMGILPQSEIKPVKKTYYEETEKLAPLKRAEIVKEIIDKGRKHKFSIAGSMSNGSSRIFTANNKGLEQYFKKSFSELSFTAKNEMGFTGSGEWGSYKIEDLNLEELIDDAFDTAEKNSEHAEAEPGKYKVVLMPNAVAGFIGWMAWGMDRRSADEKRSAFTDKLGEKIASSKVNIYYDPYFKNMESRPFSGSGLPLEKTYLVKKGKLTNLFCSRYWADKIGEEPVPYPGALIIKDGKKDINDLVKKIDRGLLIRKFWYIRMVDPMQYLLTGMTRDGVFLIEDGKITKAVNNLRFNESPINFLSNVKEIGRGRIQSTYGPGNFIYAPAMYGEDFNFSSKTLF